VNLLRDLGRVCFAVGIGAFGIQYLLYGRFVGGLAPVPPWAPGGSIFSYLVGILLLAGAAGMALLWYPRLSALLVGGFFLLCVLLLHTWHFRAVVTEGTARTRALEPLAIAAAAFVLAGTFAPSGAPASRPSVLTNFLIKSGRFVFAFTMVIFGLQHFEYARFIAALIPTWIPAHLFWVYFTGLGFIAAAAAICLKILGRLAALSLGLMFLLWFLLLHLPRVFAALRNGDEWSSAFVALNLAGACFVISTTLSREPSVPATS
jgi:uncharacterized membrane protein